MHGQMARRGLRRRAADDDPLGRLGLVLAPMAPRSDRLFDFENPGAAELRVLAMAADTFAFYWATR